jgi:hypothetical protein
MRNRTQAEACCPMCCNITKDRKIDVESCWDNNRDLYSSAVQTYIVEGNSCGQAQFHGDIYLQSTNSSTSNVKQSYHPVSEPFFPARDSFVTKGWEWGSLQSLVCPQRYPRPWLSRLMLICRPARHGKPNRGQLQVLVTVGQPSSTIDMYIETLQDTNKLPASTWTMSGSQHPCQSWISALERPGHFTWYTGQGYAGRV